MKNYGSIFNVDQQVESQDSVEPSNLRCVASQCCGVLASNCLKFTASTLSGFHIILIAELHRENSEIEITLNQLTWIASLNFLVPIGSIANGFVAQRLGSRFVMLSASICFIFVWLIYHSASSWKMVLAGRILYSLTSGAFKTPASTYITEISQPQMRGSFLATYNLAGTFGTFFSLLMGGIFYWRTVTLVNIFFPLISFAIIHFVPDSPSWLASKGRYEDARAALSWLRGWSDPRHVGPEYQSLLDNLQQSSSGSFDQKSEKQGSAGLLLERLKWSFKPFAQRSFYAPLAVVSLIYFVHFFSGVSVIQIYSMVLFEKMRSPIGEHVATAVMGAMRVVGAFVVLFSIKSAGKKKLALVSLVTAGTAYLTIAGAGFLLSQQQQQQQQGQSWLLWVPSVGLILAIFANSAGVDSIVQMLNSEVFPVSIRYVGSAIGMSCGSVIQSVMSKIFLYLVDALTLPGVFFFFACMNVVAWNVYRRIFPETEGRSLEEIEEHYRGGRGLGQARNFSNDNF